MSLDDLVPDTAAARTAREVAEVFCSPALAAHCVRSYLWAARYAADRGIDHDAELLYVSAMVHDLDPEGHLLELATALDVSGRDPQDWSADFRAEVLDRYPRSGFADRLRTNPLDA